MVTQIYTTKQHFNINYSQVNINETTNFSFSPLELPKIQITKKANEIIVQQTNETINNLLKWN